MKIIIGLGNPGKNYIGTKHNVGFEVIDRICSKYNINITKIKHKAFIGDGMVGAEKVLLLKPQTFMNLSGESVKETISFYKANINDIIVVYDDTSLPLGAVRIREKGSSGGHNGMKNIITHLGREDFLRVKIGIGKKPNGWDLASYVLSRFDKEEEPLAINAYEKGMQAVEMIIKQGAQYAMNNTNTTVKEEEK